MRKQSILLLVICLVTGCTSIEKFNRKLDVPRTDKQLKSDIDFVYKKLQKLHPRLYWYISKKELDYKFDSLKSSIHGPMTSNEFYDRLSPVVSSVKEGHLRLFPLNKKLHMRERFSLMTNGPSPIAQLGVEIFEGKMYITRNNSSDTTLRVGTEILALNNVKLPDILTRYSHTFSSDGYNQTFINRCLGKYFSSFYYFQNDIADSVLCQLKEKDTIRNVYLKRQIKNNRVSKNKTVKQLAIENEQRKKESQKRREMGYDYLTKTYSKNLNFLEPDSSIAVLKINDFSMGMYRTFYANSFKLLNAVKTQTLILDLRDNPGGKISEIGTLYSYLVDSDFRLLDKAEVTSRTSLLHTNYFKGQPIVAKTILLAFLPLRLISMGVTLCKVNKGQDKKFYYSWYGSKWKHPKPTNFKGKIYVLINGGSFSASCILSSNLKGSKRAVFVGEETGGTYNGTVAGFMPYFTLPNSKLKIRFGLALVQPYYKTEVDGRGIFPDIELEPTIDDRIKGNDVELNWVLDEIKGKHNLL